MEFSLFGQKFGSEAGIVSLMDDLGEAMSGRSKMIMMGGGNPAQIPAVQQQLKQRLQEIIDSDTEFKKLIGIYGPPLGDVDFAVALCQLLNNEYSWDLKPENIGVTNGSQAAFFMLFNLFGGEFSGKRFKKIKLPLAPEYIGYADTGITPDYFSANRPSIEMLDEHTFKYHIDFDALSLDDDIGAVCVSRPTNPSGNVLTDEEIQRLAEVARHQGVPLIVDGAYGTPFPNLIYTRAAPYWDENMVLCLSLSKFGLPAARTGIVIAREEVIRALNGVNAIMNLATGSFGGLMAQKLIASGEILTMSNELVRPYYKQKAENAVDCLHRELRGLPYAIHKAEGAMFIWLWLRECPMDNQQLYQHLKSKGVLVVSGHHFFPGLDKPWSHQYECLRLTYSQDDGDVRRGLKIIGEELRKIYA